MEKIIIKKDSKFNEKTGTVIPIFHFQDNEYRQIKADEYPNCGKIFITDGIEKIQENSFYTFDKEKLSSNKNYDEQLSDFTGGNLIYANKNPSKYVANYFYASFKKIFPFEIMSVYSNKFSFKTQKLTDSININSEVFFLEDNEWIYGPFKKNYLELSAFNFASYDDEYTDSEQYSEFLDLYSEFDGEFIFKINKDKINNFLIGDLEENLYLTDFKSIVSKGIGECFLFCDDTKLLNWGKEKIAKQKPELKTAIEHIDKSTLTNSNKTDKLKWERFKELLQNGIEEIEIEVIKKILSKNGPPQLVESENNKKIEDFENRLKDKDEKIKELIGQIDNNKFDNTIENDNLNQTNFDNFPFIKEAIKTPEKLEVTLKIKEDNNRLSARKELLEEDIAKLKKSETEIKASVQDIIKGFERSASEHTSKLAEAKYYTDLLNGIKIDITQSSDGNSNNFVPVIIEVSKSTAREYVEDVRERLKNQGREISFNDVTNLIITINQSFLTILAGAPGVGKTSLADKFSKSLGLSEKFGYLEIACAKGWNSSKDLIGFYNPLIKDFQESKSKLRTALKASSNYKNAPYIVLLDEANLSPMEHYWSDFIKLADFDYDRTIKISDKETIEFGTGFRFLATINHDHTTEILSNRLLDRASIIQIEKPEKSNNEIKQVSVNQIYNEIFDFKSVDYLFKDTSKWVTEDKTLINKLDEVVKILESNYSGFIISPRKRNSLIKYMKVATGLLEGNDYIALDYALSQQVLPLVNMRGEIHLDPLKKLNELLQKVGMEKSSVLLTRIIEKGKDFKHFKYIYY